MTEAECTSGITTAQDMMYIYHTLTSVGLSVDLSMVIEIDNQGAVHLANNWSVGGRTRHVDIQNYFLQELKDNGMLVIRHVPGVDNDADIFTKNTTEAIFEKHIRRFVGDDEYLSVEP